MCRKVLIRQLLEAYGLGVVVALLAEAAVILALFRQELPEVLYSWGVERGDVGGCSWCKNSQG